MAKGGETPQRGVQGGESSKQSAKKAGASAKKPATGNRVTKPKTTGAKAGSGWAVSHLAKKGVPKVDDWFLPLFNSISLSDLHTELKKLDADTEGKAGVFGRLIDKIQPMPEDYYIPETILDTSLDKLCQQYTAQADNKGGHDVGALLTHLRGFNTTLYGPKKLRDVIKWHPEERRALAVMRYWATHIDETARPWAEEPQAAWNNVLDDEWRTSTFEDLLNRAPALLTAWTGLIKGGTLKYTRSPAEYGVKNHAGCVMDVLNMFYEIRDLFYHVLDSGLVKFPDAKPKGGLGKDGPPRPES